MFLHLTETDKNHGVKMSKYPLSSVNRRDWLLSLVLDSTTISFSYYYTLDVDGEERRIEWNAAHRVYQCADWEEGKHILFSDKWTDISSESYLWSSAFTQCLHPRNLVKGCESSMEKTLLVRVSVPHVKADERVVIVGDCPELGNWDPACAPLLHEYKRNEWEISLPLSLWQLYSQIACKVVIIHHDSCKVVAWEEGENRIVHLAKENISRYDCVVEEWNEPCFALPDRQSRIAGMVIPVFSLKSEKSAGVGDFGDLKRMVDWAVSCGWHILQLLPVNDTTITQTWEDSYPYNALSVYALHPQYINLEAAGEIHSFRKRREFEKERKRLNALPQIDYEAVNKLKHAYLRALFAQNGKRVLASPAFKSFYEDNKRWLRPYAVFSYLRDEYGTADYATWSRFSAYKAADIHRLCQPSYEDYDRIAYYFFLQYLLDKQLKEASEYARQKGVVLKGDIPIGVARHSVDTWTEPYYFNMQSQTGAPPDAFSANGQNWGFPTYNWTSMLAGKCKWWTQRFQHLSRYFEAYRIDHILGFFRIWDIPYEAVYGLSGQFSPALPLSVEEIESYGLTFKEEYTRPYITEKLLEQTFGMENEKVRAFFFTPSENGRIQFLPSVDTQRKIKEWFNANESTWTEEWSDTQKADIEEKLYNLVSNVLFLKDRQKADYYHPRIAVQYDSIYKELLTEEEKKAFNRLYDQYFYHRHNAFWYEEASRKLPRLTQCTEMLACGEDLGMIPSCVPTLMKDQHILSLEIQSMPKEEWRTFASPLSYPYLSVCTIATHDMPTFRGWWKENPSLHSLYYKEILGKEGEPPAEATGELCKEVVKLHLASPSMLCLLSFQDWMAMNEQLRNPDVDAERINVPKIPRYYWRYRMHITIESLMAQKDFTRQIKQLVQESGR